MERERPISNRMETCWCKGEKKDKKVDRPDAVENTGRGDFFVDDDNFSIILPSMSTTIKRLYTVLTARRARYPHRNYGYVIKIDPPIETVSTGTDYEGIGWVSHAPKKNIQNFQGWYKHKNLATQRAEELNKYN